MYARSSKALSKGRAAQTSPFAQQVRTAKLLRWDSDTRMSRQMEDLIEARDFLAFCLENQDSFTRRDWLASLTLLTTRRHLDIGPHLRSPPTAASGGSAGGIDRLPPQSTCAASFAAYNEAVLKRVSLFEDSLHLLIHRYGVLSYSPALWRLSGYVESRVAGMAMAKVALTAWGLAKALVSHEDVWRQIGRQVTVRTDELGGIDAAMLAWSFARIERRKPAEILALKTRITALLNNGSAESSSQLTAQDLCMAFRAFASLTPRDTAFLSALLAATRRLADEERVALPSQGLTSLWSALADLGQAGWRDDNAIEWLCEESRRLRLDHTFNQNMVAEIALAVRQLQVRDPRIVYQLVHWVDKKGECLRAEQLLTVVDVFSSMDINHEGAWKRLGTRVQRAAIELDMADIQRILQAFEHVGQLNDRVRGVLSLFISTKGDEMAYGTT
ncbi:unnamed protein product [Vitrella brassicaformis CCMP3155]|uniref:Uncharacterized protein n=1 Tax=Vitrella brassicaformis (strain CCMP3155) TaxID=1169540 RepID=A0A0G4EMF5_VITBC|nr:unnamed protein product [Vitrella brassicaformis CCMP3155]|eukprot:CEL98570.1 unnamed protein product [Vitrella brassicaformis CCMP3155]